MKTIQLNEQEIQYILNVLAERPYKECSNLIVNIVRQAIEKPAGPEIEDNGEA
jgi:hypothetical protein